MKRYLRINVYQKKINNKDISIRGEYKGKDIHIRVPMYVYIYIYIEEYIYASNIDHL